MPKSKGKQCCVFGCDNFAFLKEGTKSGIHFFHIPKSVLEDKGKRRRWCSLIKRQDGRDSFSLNKNTVICADHFLENQVSVSLGTKKWTLKPGEEPKVFSWRSPLTERKGPTLRTPLSARPVTSDDFENIREPLLSDDQYVTCKGVGTQTCRSTTDVACQTDAEHFHPEKISDHDYTMLDPTVNVAKKEVEHLETIINNLSQDMNNLQEQLNDYEKKVFSIEKIKDDAKAMLFYTGFPTYSVFNSVLKYLSSKAERLQYWRGKQEISDIKFYQTLGPESKPGHKRKLSVEDEFLIVLLRLKVGLFVRDIADRFRISQSQFSKIFTTWINFLYHELPMLFPFPSQKSVKQNLPKSFACYPTTRIILDCTEIFIEVPSSMLAQSETWSSYKHHNTYKILVGVSPNGTITFVSDLWGGRVSDKQITKESGVIELLEPGDNVMCDRGFEIQDILPEGVSLNIPPFKLSKQQLSAEEVESTMKIACVRIHVERAIGRIKNYHILDGVMPLSLKHIANQIFTVVSYLTNFLPPLVSPGAIEDE